MNFTLKNGFKYYFLLFKFGVSLIDISTYIGDLRLRNPTILASGIMGEDAGSIKRIAKCGAGAIVTKSIGIKERFGYRNPTLIELECGLLNAMGLPNPGIVNFKEEMEKLEDLNVPVIGSIFGSNLKEFVELANKMENYGADGLELNMSCPHARGYGLEIGCNERLVNKITYEVKKKVDIPVFVKISPNINNVVKIAKAAEKGRADGVVAINTLKAMKIDINLKMPVLANKIGGYSGKAIKPIGVRCVYEIFENVKIPVIGVGGVVSGEDALEYIMAGASAVQIGSGIYYRDIDVFKKVCKEIKAWMKINNYKKLSKLIGAAHV